MLKLRSMASATASGKSPIAKFVTVCGSPFSRNSKSDCFSPPIAFPCASVTLAYTSTTFTPDVNWACATGVARTASARRMVIQSTDPARDNQGARPMGLGLPEVIVIVLIIIMIFGANRLPEIGRGIGKGIRNFKESAREGMADKRDD